MDLLPYFWVFYTGFGSYATGFKLLLNREPLWYCGFGFASMTGLGAGVDIIGATGAAVIFTCWKSPVFLFSAVFWVAVILPNRLGPLSLLPKMLGTPVFESLKIDGFSLTVSLMFGYSFCLLVGAVVTTAGWEEGAWFWLNKLILIDYFGLLAKGLSFENKLPP